MQQDEVALRNQLRYDNKTNCIIGLNCVADVKEYKLEIADHLGALKGDLDAGRVNIATLASVVGFSLLYDSQPHRPMGCTATTVYGASGRRRDAESELPIFLHLITAHTELLAEARVQVVQVASDGDSVRSNIIASTCLWSLPKAKADLLEGVTRVNFLSLPKGVSAVRDVAHLHKRLVQPPRTRGLKFGRRPDARLTVAEIKQGVKLAGHQSELEATSMMNPADKMRTAVAQKMLLLMSRFRSL